MRGDKKYLAITFMIITFIGTLFFNVIHLQKEEELRIINDKISKNNSEIASIKKFNDEHKNFDEEMTNLADRHFRIYMAFSETLNDENIIDFLREAANKHNLEILLLSTNDIKDEKYEAKAFYQTFKIKLRGDYFPILDFVLELSNSNGNNLYFFDIRNMYLKKESNLLTLDLEFNCYFSK